MPPGWIFHGGPGFPLEQVAHSSPTPLLYNEITFRVTSCHHDGTQIWLRVMSLTGAVTSLHRGSDCTMGMTTRLVGFRPPDSRWKEHKRVWDACVAAGVEVPRETAAFLDYTSPHYDESPSIAQASAFDRGCRFVKDERGWLSRENRPADYREGFYIEPGEPVPEGMEAVKDD